MLRALAVHVLARNAPEIALDGPEQAGGRRFVARAPVVEQPGDIGGISRFHEDSWPKRFGLYCANAAAPACVYP